jgi:hypothetical protein
MVWSPSAQGIRPSERGVYANHVGVSLSRLSPPPLFCSPYRSRVLSGVEEPLAYPERSRGFTPSNSFRSNTYRIVWKCSFQKTYRNSKSFRRNTYKKPGGGGTPPSRSDSGFYLATRHSYGSVPRCLCGHPHAPLSSRWSPVVFRRKTPSIPFFFILLPDPCRPNEGGVHPPYGNGPSMWLGAAVVVKFLSLGTRGS